jgi:hypothetical protein
MEGRFKDFLCPLQVFSLLPRRIECLFALSQLISSSVAIFEVLLDFLQFVVIPCAASLDIILPVEPFFPLRKA